MGLPVPVPFTEELDSKQLFATEQSVGHSFAMSEGVFLSFWELYGEAVKTEAGFFWKAR